MKELVSHIMVDFTQMKSFSEDPLIWTKGDGIWLTDIHGGSTSTASPGPSA